MIPSVPSNFYVQMGNAQILLTWDLVPGATSYSVQRSIDGVSYTALASPTLNEYKDTTAAIGTKYFYQVASVNGSGTSNYNQYQANGLVAMEIPTVSGQMSLYAIRLASQQMADRVNSSFVSMPGISLSI